MLTGDQVRAVEFRGNVRGQFAGLKRARGELRYPATLKENCRPNPRRRESGPRTWLDGVHGIEAGLRTEAENKIPGRDHPGSDCPYVLEIPMVRSPCTLLCPRTGQAPAPGRPIFPLRKRKFITSSIVATELRCWVSPIAQQQMIRSLRMAMSAASRICCRVNPLAFLDLLPIGSASSSRKGSKPTQYFVNECAIEDASWISLFGRRAFRA